MQIRKSSRKLSRSRPSLAARRAWPRRWPGPTQQIKAALDACSCSQQDKFLDLSRGRFQLPGDSECRQDLTLSYAEHTRDFPLGWDVSILFYSYT